MLLLAVLALCGALLEGRQAPASPWPRFRGPNGTGVATDKDIPVQWSTKDGMLWQTAIPGLGNSSPIVWRDSVFLQSASADSKARLLVCLNAVDGKVAWSRSVPGARAPMHPKNTLASSTPATDGQRVYAVFWDGKEVSLQAYDFQGKHLWKHDLGRFTSQHGVGASPIVFQDKVFLANDQDGTAELVVLDARTGKPVWQAPRVPFRACYSTPMVLERPGLAPELVVLSTTGITSYDPQNGGVNWNYAWTFTGMPLRTVASPLYADGMIFANSGDGGGARHTVAVKLAGKGDISKNLVWEEKRSFPYVPTMLLSGEYLYAVNDRGVASCHVAATGETLWSERLGGGFTASPVLIDGKVYAINEEGTVFVIAASPTFKLLARNSLGEPVMATPAIADNRLFIRGANHLFCIARTPEKQATQHQP
jgi:outer membrane protein assembly factor BamB